MSVIAVVDFETGDFSQVGANGTPTIVASPFFGGGSAASLDPDPSEDFLDLITGRSLATAGCRGSFYLVSTLPNVRIYTLMLFWTGSSALVRLHVNSSGHLEVETEITGGFTGTTTGSYTIAPDTPYEITTAYDAAAGGIVKVWIRSEAEIAAGTAATLDISVTHASAGTNVERIDIKNSQSGAPTYICDAFTVCDTATQPPTRFKLTADATAPAVSPALQSYSHNAPTTVRSTLNTFDASTLATVAYTPDGADHLVAGDALHRQFVSDPMSPGIVFTNGDAIEFSVQALEAHTNNNLQVQLFVSVVNQAGDTVRRTLRSKVLEGNEVNTSLRNVNFSTTQDGATYTTVSGDRLVVEFSVSGTPTAAGGTQGHNASLRWGGSGSGGYLPKNDTETGTTFNPWIEFAPNITFATAGRTALNTRAFPLGMELGMGWRMPI